jgi:hypothetical protein
VAGVLAESNNAASTAGLPNVRDREDVDPAFARRIKRETNAAGSPAATTGSAKLRSGSTIRDVHACRCDRPMRRGDYI